MKVLALMLGSVVYLTPTLVQSRRDWWPSFFPRESIRLGFDLRGGIQLVLSSQACSSSSR
jgi:preprotein translocase subunit SecD